ALLAVVVKGAGKPANAPGTVALAGRCDQRMFRCAPGPVAGIATTGPGWPGLEAFVMGEHGDGASTLGPYIAMPRNEQEYDTPMGHRLSPATATNSLQHPHARRTGR